MTVTPFPALIIQGGVTKQIPTADTLQVGIGIDTRAGNTTLFVGPGGVNSVATTVQIGASTVGVNLAGATTVTGSNAFTTGTGTVTINGNVTTTGSPNFNFSGSSGSFDTSSGANTLHGNTTVSGSNTFTVGSGATTLGGNLSQSNGVVSLTANGSSSFTTSSGALTLTSAAAATWSAVGGLTVDSTTALNLGTGTSTSVNIGQTADLTTVNGSLTVAGATTTLSALGLGVVHASLSGVLSSSLVVNADISGSAAISVSKLAGGTDAQILQTNSSTPEWVTFSQDATVADSGVVTVVSAHGNFAVGGTLTVTGASTFNGNASVTGSNTFSVGTGATTLGGSLAVTGTSTLTGALTANGGTSTTTLSTSGLATLASASVTGNETVGGTLGVTGATTLSSTLAVTGATTATGGVLTNSVDTITGTTLTLGGTTATAVTIGGSSTTTTIPGNLAVSGTETIVGTSVFQSNATFDGDVTIADGYVLHTDSITTAGTGGSGVLTINSTAGTNLQLSGTNYLQVGTTPGFIYVPSGVTLEASGTGMIIATSSTGTADITIPANTAGTTAGYAVYMSGNGAVGSADPTNAAKCYCVGFAEDSLSSGHVYTDGLVTPSAIAGSPTFGQVMYLDPATPGGITNVAPTTAGQYVAPVGFMYNATQMVIRVLTPVLL